MGAALRAANVQASREGETDTSDNAQHTAYTYQALSGATPQTEADALHRAIRLSSIELSLHRDEQGD
jgi:hypothetical protein